MFKRIISVIICLSMICGCVTVWADNADILINETFENYAINSSPGSVVMEGTDVRVVERNGSDKAVYGKIWGSGVVAKLPISKSYDTMTYSFDLKVTGDRIMGDAVKFSNSVSLLRLGDDGGVYLEDNYQTGGYSDGRWHSYAAAINYKTGLYDFYVDGKLLLSKWKFSSTLTRPTELIFSFNALDDNTVAEIMIDNIRVYSGNKILSEKDFPKKEVNTEVYDFTPATEKNTGGAVIIDSYGKDGIQPYISFQGKQDAAARWEIAEDGSGDVVYFRQTNTFDCYADIKTESMPMKYVYQTDIYLKSQESGSVIVGRTNDGKGGNSNILMINAVGNLCVGSSKVASIPLKKWVNVAIASDHFKGTGDVYVDGVLVREDIGLPSGGIIPTYIRIGFTSTGTAGENEVWFKDFKIYGGDKLLEFEKKTDTEETVSDITEFNYFLERSSDAQTLLGDDTVFITSNNKCYINREKKDYSSYKASPYVTDSGVLMVPSEIIGDALDVSTEITSNKITIDSKHVFSVGEANEKLDSAPEQKNGEIYLPVVSLSRNFLKRYVYDDDRGFVIISKNNRGYVDNIDDVNDKIDAIQRYLHFDRPTEAQIYEDVKNTSYGVHPRLIATTEEIDEVKRRIEGDSEYRKYYEEFISTCEGYMSRPLIEHKSDDGLRFYGALTSAGTVVYNLGMAYLLTGDAKYAERAWLEYENILSWPDWNVTRHYLDTGASVPRFIKGYDAIYNYLTPERRAYFVEQFQKLYLDYAVGIYNGTSVMKPYDMRLQDSNWAAVCGAGMLYASLGLIDAEGPESPLTAKCKYLATQAMRTFEYATMLIAPSGASAEGLVYSEYFMSNIAEMADILYRTCGKDYNMFTTPGSEYAPEFFMYAQSSAGVYSYSANKYDMENHFPLETFKYAKLLKNQGMSNALYAFMNTIGKKGNISLAFNYTKDDSVKVNYPLDHYFEKLEMVVMKESWDDVNAIYAGAVGGIFKNLETDPDKGSFVFNALNEKWFVDLGNDNYNVTGGNYFEKSTKNKLYRLRTEGHNCIVFDPNPAEFGQLEDERGDIIRYETSDRGAIAVYDLAPVYPEKVQKYYRGIHLTDDRQALVVQDEVTLGAKSNMYWFAHTPAEIQLSSDGKSAILTQNGKKVRIEVVSNLPDWKLEVMKADPLDESTYVEGELSRDMFRKLAIHVPDASGTFTISAKITVVDDYYEQKPLEVKPIAEWTIPEGAVPQKPQADSVTINGTPLDGFVPGNKAYEVPFYVGSDAPVYAASSSSGTVSIKQPATLHDTAVITVKNEKGIKATYTFVPKVDIRIFSEIKASSTSIGLPSGIGQADIISTYANHNPQSANMDVNATDGKADTRWSSDANGAYLEVDLGEVKSLSGVGIIFMNGSERQSIFDILISDDKEVYRKIYSGKSSGQTNDWEYIPAAVNARYVRYAGYGNTSSVSSSWNSICEFRPYVAE